jgi:GNAT superfamily N-acetyltransferase
MITINIKPDQIPFFSQLDPYGFMSALGLPDSLALGAVLDDSGEDIPVGLCICRRAGASIRIEWLAVDEEYRAQGIGDELCYQVVSTAAQYGYAGAEAAFYLNPGREENSEAEKFYFADHDFTQDRGSVCYIVISLDEMRHLPFFEGYRSAKKLPSLSSISREELSAIETKLEDKRHFGCSCQVRDVLALADKELSFYIPSDDGIGGALLMRRSEGVITPIAIGADDTALVRSLMFSGLDAAFAACERDTKVYIAPSDNTWDLFLEAIFGDRLIHGQLKGFDDGNR